MSRAGNRFRGVAALCVLALLFFSSVGHGADERVDLLALGDWGIDTPAQAAVASAMKGYVEKNGIALDAVLLLGDNFYVDLEKGVEDPAWKELFERRFDRKGLDVPFYAVLGNHDYSGGKAQIQLDYAKRNPGSRFKMPARWYRADLPGERPLVALIALDSNRGSLGKEKWPEQARWLESELSKVGEIPWTVCFAHHPLFSDSVHGDEDDLQEAWGPAFKKNDVDFYLAGHDHALQHLQIPEWPMSFLVSGGGGYDLYEIEGDRAAFARSVHGFVHLRFTPEKAQVVFVDRAGKTIHRFERARAGKVTVGEGTSGTR
jgi:tartrate-resistant acid phosphatase type 5